MNTIQGRKDTLMSSWKYIQVGNLVAYNMNAKNVLLYLRKWKKKFGLLQCKIEDIITHNPCMKALVRRTFEGMRENTRERQAWWDLTVREKKNIIFKEKIGTIIML